MTDMLTRSGQPPIARGPTDAMTVADLHALDTTGDTRRYELLDGALVVTPAPSLYHQDLQAQLFRALDAALPDDFKLYVAPVDVVLDDHTLVQPDLLVVRASDASGPRLTGLPVLAVEILSPSTRSLDLGAKHERYARAGIPHFWTADPTTGQLRAWQLDPQQPGYQLVADTGADDREITLAVPFPVTLEPSRWRRR